MYLYLYDSFLNNKKYNNILAKIEARLTDLGIGGKICRLSPLKNIQELIEDEIKNGVRTIVGVGNDKTLIQIVNIIAQCDITLGFIPISSESQVAKILGIPSGEKSCEILSARRIEKLDLGKVNNVYFLSGLKIPEGKVIIECEKNYCITPYRGQNQIQICNFGPVFATGFSEISYFNPQDGLLEILIQPFFGLSFKLFNLFKKTKIKSSNFSIFPFRKILIRGKKSVSVITDDQRVLKTPVLIEIVPQKLKMIVGKDRLF